MKSKSARLCGSWKRILLRRPDIPQVVTHGLVAVLSAIRIKKGFAQGDLAEAADPTRRAATDKFSIPISAKLSAENLVTSGSTLPPSMTHKLAHRKS